MTPVPGSDGTIRRIINGPVLSGAHWSMTVKNLDPSTHRLRNAFGLSAGLLLGRKTMNVLTGETTTGEKVDRDEIPFFLRPLHGIFAYNHFSDDPNDRWRKVADNWIPAFTGGAGAVLGSYDFAMDQAVGGTAYGIAKEAQKDLSKLTLEKAETWAKFTQSHPWRTLSGFTAMFGSASGFQLMTGLNNYGATLGSSFIGAVNRDKLSTPFFPGLQRFISGNHHYYPFGPSSMLPRLRDYLVHNPDKTPAQTRDMVYAILEPWFGEQVTPKHVETFANKLLDIRGKYLGKHGVAPAKKVECSKALEALLSGEGFEKELQALGFDLQTASIGRNGFIESVARMLGSEEKLNLIEQQYHKAYAARNKLPAPSSMLTRTLNHTHDGKVMLAGTAIAGLGAAAVGGLALYARRWHEEDNEKLMRSKTEALSESVVVEKNGEMAAIAPNEEHPLPEVKNQPVSAIVKNIPVPDTEHPETVAGIADRYLFQQQCSVERKEEKKEHPVMSWLNDKPLKFLEWAADGLNSPETLGLHRLSCAIGLTGGGLIGMKLTEALTGRNFAGAEVPKDKIMEVLHPLYKKLAYNPFSDHPKDKWGYVMHLAIPSVFATAGIITASSLFFRNRTQQAAKAVYIDQFDDKANAAQSEPWTLLTATSSLLATPSGNVFLPIPGINYGLSLGTRFTLSAGRKMIFPGVGELWTGNASRYPYGPSLLRDYMIKYAINNPSPHPEQLEEMAIGILKPWFKNVTGDQILAFVHKVEEDRDRFYKEGGVPEEAKAELEKTLIKHFKGAGLEQTLHELGFDLTQAELGNNGVSTTVAKWMGAGTKLEAIHKEFEEKLHKRWDSILTHEKPEKKEFAPLIKQQRQMRENISPNASISA